MFEDVVEWFGSNSATGSRYRRGFDVFDGIDNGTRHRSMGSVLHVLRTHYRMVY